MLNVKHGMSWMLTDAHPCPCASGWEAAAPGSVASARLRGPLTSWEGTQPPLPSDFFTGFSMMRLQDKAEISNTSEIFFTPVLLQNIRSA